MNFTNNNTNPLRKKQTITFLLVAIPLVILIGIVAILVSLQIPALGPIEWTYLLAPAIILIIALGLFKYDALVFLTFCLIGFVRNEPATFDLLLIPLFGIGLLTGRLELPNTPSRYRIYIFVGLFGLILTNLASVLMTALDYDSFRYLGITLYMLALFVFTRMYATKPQNFVMLLLGYTVSVVINSFVVVLGFLGFDLPFDVLDWSVRGVGFFKDPNVFGPFALVSALWLIYHVMQSSSKPIRNGFLAFLALMMAFGATLSLSRAVWFNLFVSSCIILFFVFRRDSRRGIIFVVIMASFTLVAVSSIQIFGLNSLVEDRMQLQGYDIERFRNQAAGIIAGLTHPLGVGPGMWSDAHSLYVRTLAEQGVVGLFSLLSLLGGIVLATFNLALKEKYHLRILSAKVILAIVIGQLINSFVIDSIHWRHFWFVLGIAWAYLDFYTTKENNG